MDSYIQTLNAGLARMEELMKSLLVIPSDFETLLSLYLLYKEHQHTNTLIDYAEGVLKSGEGIDRLLAEATELNQLVTRCNQLYTGNLEAFDNIDNDALFEAHIKPFRDAEKAEADSHHAKVNEFHRLYNEEVKCCSAALSFTLEDLSVLFFYMQRISQSIIDTITKPQGE